MGWLMIFWMIVNVQSDDLQDPDPHVRQRAARELIARRSIDSVLPLLESSDPDLREQARSILVALDFDPARRRSISDSWAAYASTGSAELRDYLIEAARWCSDVRPSVLRKIHQGLFAIESREFFTSRRRHALALNEREFAALPEVLLAMTHDASPEWQRDCLSWRWDPRASIQANPYIAERVYVWAIHAYGVHAPDDALAGMRLFESFFDSEPYRSRARKTTALLQESESTETDLDEVAPRGNWSTLPYTVNRLARDLESPVAKILAQGTAALPALMDSLQDRRATRLVVLDDDSRVTLLRVSDLALHLIERITGLRFAQPAAAREWWERSRLETPERWWEQWIAGPGTRERIEPAKRLVQSRGKEASDSVWSALQHAQREERLPLAAMLAELKDPRIIAYLNQLGRDESSYSMIPPIYRALRLADVDAANAYLADRLSSLDIDAFGISDEILSTLLVDLASSDKLEHGRMLIDLASSPFVPAHFRVPLLRSLGHLRTNKEHATDLLAHLLTERKFLWVEIIYREGFAWEIDALLCDVAADALSRLRPDAPAFELDNHRDQRDLQIRSQQAWLRREWKSRPMADQVNR